MLKLAQAALNNLKSNNSKGLSVVKYDKLFKSTAAESKAASFETEDALRTTRQVKTNSMVAAAFASLRPSREMGISTPITDEKINKAENVNDLLSISEGSGISRKHALKVVSTLAEWSSSGKAKVSDFENDTRFIKLCRILSKGAKINRNMMARSEDLSTILNVTADEEAARLISGLNMTQMVKVMTTLTIKKRRSVLLLRTLAYNIAANSEHLNLKQSADLLYSMCLLNFIDENLLSKICGDVTSELRKEVEKSAVVGSIITSIGLLKYKNCEILDTLSEWVFANRNMCRSQDVFSLFVTLATVNYMPGNSEEIFKELAPQLSVLEASKPSVWLDFVWSLVILEQATTAHISSVLSQDFVDKIADNTSAKLKLLNINGAAEHLVKNYDSNLLSPLSEIHNVKSVNTKEKARMIETVVDTLKNLMQVENHLILNKNTGLGRTIDAECLLDKKCNPLPLNKGHEAKSDTTRVVFVVLDYHDMCIGKIEPTGPNALFCRLLEAQKYKILTVPYFEFRATDKLVHRVQYLETKLKNIVK